MNDTEFQDWTEELATLRKARREWLSNQIKQKKAAFTVADFYQEMIRTLGEMVDRWWEREQNSEQRRNTPLDRAEVERLKSEVDGLIQFELSAIDDDLVYAQGQIPLDRSEIEKEQHELNQFANQLTSSYEIKIGAASTKKDGEISKSFDPFPDLESPSGTQVPSVRKRPVTGFPLIGMFLVGLFLGGVSSIFVWKSYSNSQEALHEELARLKSKNKDLEDRFVIYQKNYLMLAEGRMKSVPELEAQIEAVHQRFEAQKKATKKLADRQALAAREKREIAPLVDQLETLKKAIR